MALILSIPLDAGPLEMSIQAAENGKLQITVPGKLESVIVDSITLFQQYNESRGPKSLLLVMKH